jgi:hypothetical protein
MLHCGLPGYNECMNLFILLIALLAAPACCGSIGKAGNQSSEAIPPPSHSDLPGQVIVVFKKGVSPACARSIVETHSMTIARQHEALYKYSDQVFLHLISDTLTSEEMVRRLEKDSRVHRVKEEFYRSVLPDSRRPVVD